MPGITCPVIAYAPMAAMMPSIARRPLSFSEFSLNIVGIRELDYLEATETIAAIANPVKSPPK